MLLQTHPHHLIELLALFLLLIIQVTSQVKGDTLDLIIVLHLDNLLHILRHVIVPFII
jgi:hypothetical protein